MLLDIYSHVVNLEETVVFLFQDDAFESAVLNERMPLT